MELLNLSALPQARLTELCKSYPWLGRYPWELCRYARREYLCHYRESVERLIFLLEGAVSVSLTPPHGRTHIITYATVDDLICGDVEVALGSSLASADLRAEENTLCLTLPIAPHREALLGDNDFLRFALARLSTQMVRQSIYTANNLLFPLENRMAAYILYYLVGDPFEVNLTHTAELMGASYRQLSRVMREYRERGFLEKTDSGWRILDRSALEVLAQDVEATIL